MRVLKPEVAQKRKENILNWLVYKYVTTGKPISSELIFEGGNFNLSSATIRNILKELEDEGYLNQVHTSGGRVPSDKGYRAYVNSLMHLQNMAENEREKLEIDYDRKMEQLDYFLKNTSKLLAEISKMAGFTLFSDISQEYLKRIDIVKVSAKNYLSIIVTDANIIKHIPFTLEIPVEKNNLRALVLKLNKSLKGIKISDIKEYLIKNRPANETEKEIYRALVKVMEEIQRQEDSLYLDGLTAIFENNSDYEYDELISIARILEEKEKFVSILKEKLKDCSKNLQIENQNQKQIGKRKVDVTIGSENSIKEFKNFSMVSSSYCLKDKAVGLVGVIGYKRMEYPKVISIVDEVSSIIEESISKWEMEEEEF